MTRRLGIGRTALSAFTKELTGLSAAHLADRLRAKGVKQKFKSALRAFLTGELAQRCKDAKDEGEEGASERISVDVAWHRLNAARKKGREYSLSSQAVAMGFSSYARFYRACLSLYGKTPGELEYEVLAECVREANGGSVNEPEAAEPTLIEARAEFRQRWPEGRQLKVES